MPIIPKHIITGVAGSSSWKLRRQFPGKYHLTVQKGDWLTRYVSDAPSVAISEAWLQYVIDEALLPPSRDGGTSWCLIDNLSDGQLFFMFVRDDVVREAKAVSLEALDVIKLKLVDSVFIASTDNAHEIKNTLEERGVHRIDTIAALNPERLKAYALKPTRLKMGVLGTLVLLTLGVGLSGYQSYQAKTQVKSDAVHVVDPYQGYRNQMRTAVSAGEAMQAAMMLTLNGVFGPEHWPLESVTLKGHELSAEFVRDKQGLMSTAKNWLHSKSFKSFSTLSFEKLQINAPLSVGMNHWVDSIAPMSRAEELLDLFIRMGWTNSHSEYHTDNQVRMLTMALKKNDASIIEFRSYATLLNDLPVTISNLKMMPNDDGSYRVDMQIQFIGEEE